MNQVRDYSDFDATNDLDAIAFYQRFERAYHQALEQAESSDERSAGENLAFAFEMFRAAEQIGDAYFFEHREFIDDKVDRHEVEIPQPAPKPKWAFHRAHMISPDYRDRLIEYVESNHPRLVDKYNEIYCYLTAEPVVRVGGSEPSDVAVPGI